MKAPKWPLGSGSGESANQTAGQAAGQPVGQTVGGAAGQTDGRSVGHVDGQEGRDEPRGHDGGELPADADFFVPAPPEIGRVITAYTTLTKSMEPFSPTRRLLIVACCMILGVIIGAGIVSILDVESAVWRIILIGGLGAVGLLCGWAFALFKGVCTYVGERGVAKHVCKNRRENIAQQEIFLFDQATELRTAITRQYTNGVYTGTSYRFEWKGARGERQFLLGGHFRDKEGNPPPKDLFHFAESAESVWTYHLLERAQGDLDDKGYVHFGLNGEDYVRVGRGYMEFCIKGNRARCDIEDIDTLQISQGLFTIKRKDAKVGWFRKDGVFRFSYATMANAKLFLLALDRVLGFRFS